MKRIIVGALVVALALPSITFSVASALQSGPDIPAVKNGAGGIYSYHWSGFAATSSKRFTLVTAQWQVPTATCLGTVNESHSIWVGFDGFMKPSKTVEQGGTYAYCSGTTPSYYAWWEMFPTNTMQIVYNVFPGDLMKASVTYASGTFKIVVNDTTTAHQHSFSTSRRCASGLTCARSTAEWIGELPLYSSPGHLAEWSTPTAQAQFGFSAAYAATGATKLGIGFLSTIGINLINRAGTTLAGPGPVDRQGTDFEDYWFAES